VWRRERKMSEKAYRLSWSTNNEKDHIDQLVSGAFAWKGPYVPRLSPEERLQSYIKTAKMRKKWDTFGGVNADEVILYAQGLLDKLQGEADEMP
jgi:hypothetical protein